MLRPKKFHSLYAPTARIVRRAQHNAISPEFGQGGTFDMLVKDGWLRPANPRGMLAGSFLLTDAGRQSLKDHQASRRKKP